MTGAERCGFLVAQRPSSGGNLGEGEQGVLEQGQERQERQRERGGGDGQGAAGAAGHPELAAALALRALAATLALQAAERGQPNGGAAAGGCPR